MTLKPTPALLQYSMLPEVVPFFLLFLPSMLHHQPLSKSGHWIGLPLLTLLYHLDQFQLYPIVCTQRTNQTTLSYTHNG